METNRNGRDPPTQYSGGSDDDRRGRAWAMLTGIGFLIPLLLGASWWMAGLMGGYFGALVMVAIYRWNRLNARAWMFISIIIAAFAGALWAFGVPNGTPFRCWLLASLVSGGAAVVFKPWCKE